VDEIVRSVHCRAHGEVPERNHVKRLINRLVLAIPSLPYDNEVATGSMDLFRSH